jgi:hypothetical protein
MKIIRFEKTYFQAWDDFTTNCPMTTFLHMRKFLSYHGKKFNDQSLLIFDKKDKLVGILPAAENLQDEKFVVSHPGITYGGLLHQGKLLGQNNIDALADICKHYKSLGFNKFVYKTIPKIFHQHPSEDDLYSLFKLNAKLVRRDLNCVINLQEPPYLSSNALSTLRRLLQKSKRNDVKISCDLCYLEPFWNLLAENLSTKYNAKPTHNFAELKILLANFPQNIELVVAIKNNEVLAGSLLFINNATVHVQYLTNSPAGRELFALDYLLQNCINNYKNLGYHYFSLGISNENEGQYLNHLLYRSKTKHGGSGVAHDFYEINLGLL